MASKLSEDTELQVPLKNIITLIIATAVAVAAYFEMTERITNIETSMTIVGSDRITNIETSMTIVGSDIEKNTDFRIRWPRGEMGSLPADAEQFMLIEHLSKELSKLSKTIESGEAPFDQQQKLTLEFYEKRIEALERQIENLKNSIMDAKHQELKVGGAHH
jgi:predicted RNase H-like nuclease (RuvC/YqgF family)